MTAAVLDPAVSPALTELRAKIGWLCHLVRVVGMVYLGWIFFNIVQGWLNAAGIIRNFGAFYGKNLEGLSGLQRAGGFSWQLFLWSLTAVTIYCLWRLTGGYLKGRIFTVDAALWMLRLASFAIIATALDVCGRPLVSLILTAHLSANDHVFKFWFSPLDLLHLLIFVALFALAHIFKTAAEIADDNAAIV